MLRMTAHIESMTTRFGVVAAIAACAVAAQGSSPERGKLPRNLDQRSAGPS
jgi:hypothetical protein